MKATIDVSWSSTSQIATIGGYRLSYSRNKKAGHYELILTPLEGAGHRAIHTHFNKLDNFGNIIERPPITPEVANFIFKNFHIRGHSESFNIVASDLSKGILEFRKPKIEPQEIRHVLGGAETSFTSTGAKLNAHWPIFHKLRDTNFSSIIRATMTNHQVCSSRCHFCSTIARNQRDSVTLEEAKNFVTALYYDQAEHNRKYFSKYNEEYKKIHGTDIRLKGLILSGGGQPNLWPHFEEFVTWLKDLDIDLGLITNGFPKKVSDQIYECFKWVRISITPSDASSFYPEGKFEKQFIPQTILNNPNITVGYSYVDGPWREDNIFNRLDISAKENGFDYVRVLSDCNLGRSAQLQAHHDLAERLFQSNLIDENGKPKSRLFQQLKYHGTEENAHSLWDSGQCYLQSYNVFWDTTGHEKNGKSYCYPCDSVTVLADDAPTNNSGQSERRFNSSKWGTVTNDEVSRLFTEPLRPFFDPRRICHSCLFMRNNSAVKNLIKRENFNNLEITKNIQHLNFP